MIAIRRFLEEKRVYVALVGGAVLGLALGLLIGWVLWPVQWTNTTPANLDSAYRDDYLLYIVENYEANGGAEWAKEKLGFEYWDPGDLAATFGRLEERTDGATLDRVINLEQALLASEPDSAEAQGGIPGGGEPIGDEPTTLDMLQPFLLVCGVALVVAAIVGGVILLFGRREGGARRAAGGGDGAQEESVDAAGLVEEQRAPQAQFVTSYSLGDDHYDPSFSIELETGEFMGECGVGISDTLGTGEPNKVTAFEIWLFDKNDIRTVTKVLMSEYAYGDEALRTKLAPKGEPILAKVGDHVVLETKRLRVQARLLDLAYGDGDLPASSYFSRLTLDLTAWVKPGPGADALMDGETPFM